MPATPVRTHWKHLIPTPSGQVQHLRRSDGTSETLYLPGEHLGSVDVVLDAGGAVLARPSFNAWGARRSSSWSGSPSAGEWQAIANTSRRGYTGHEQLDNVMLVHMNGRVYDPAIGRFLSADPFIDCEQNTQGWNRYSYVKGGVLRYTDPSGYKMDDAERPIRAIAPNDANPTTGLPVDPLSQLETITVTASRITLPGQVNISVRFTPAPGPGGGGRQGRDPKKDKEECVKGCRTDFEGAIQATSGAVGGAVSGAALGARTGNLGVVVGGAIVGLATGAATGLSAQGVSTYGGTNGQASAISATAGAAVGYTSSAMVAGGSATFGSAMAGAASGVVGGAVPGAAGAAGSAAVGAIGTHALSITGRGVAGFFGGIAALGTYMALDRAADEFCEAKCGQ